MIAAVKYLKIYLVKERIEEFPEGKFHALMEWAVSVDASSALIVRLNEYQYYKKIAIY